MDKRIFDHDGYMLGKELMKEETDKRMLFKQRLSIILFGAGVMLFASLALYMEEVAFAILCVIGGGILIITPFMWILPFELIVYEQGFYARMGKRVEVSRFENVENIAYGIVTNKGKDTDGIRGYIVFGAGKEDLFLPAFHKTRPSQSWAEISDCLIDTYTDVTGKVIDDELRRIPM